LKYGYCVYIDEIDTDYFPEQGPVWDWIRENRHEILQRLGANYRNYGAGTLRKIPEESLQELRAIFAETGALERFEQIKKSGEEPSTREKK
jgi:heterodisulfide reductase subunit C